MDEILSSIRQIIADDDASTAPAPAPKPAAPRPAASVARAAPMPDPTLSNDIADQLLEPATDAAVMGAMSRLGSLADTGIGSMTIEAMIRQMLKPMLKDWLDENLPSMVERLVEREISRISRGVK
jgi:cell pole-organizing protein PopZ